VNVFKLIHETIQSQKKKKKKKKIRFFRNRIVIEFFGVKKISFIIMFTW